jgi:hypothetical protein
MTVDGFHRQHHLVRLEQIVDPDVIAAEAMHADRIPSAPSADRQKDVEKRNGRHLAAAYAPRLKITASADASSISRVSSGTLRISCGRCASCPSAGHLGLLDRATC